MQPRLLIVLLAAAGLTACGADTTPTSSGAPAPVDPQSSAGASTPAPTAQPAPAEKLAAQEEKKEQDSEKKSD